MIRVYVMPSCPDCDRLKAQLICDEIFEVIDISSHVRRLKEFVRLRDTNPAFVPIKESGSIGIPCFLKEDGSVTFNPEDVGLKDEEEETVTEGAACNLDGTGC